MTSISSRFYSTFPREFGLKRRIVKDYDDFLSMSRRQNGIMNCYTNLYDYEEHTEWGKPIYDTCIWDRMIWDFDCEGDLANELTQRVSDYLLKHDTLHTIIFSGRGYHIYSFCDPNLDSPSSAIRKYQEQVCRELDIPLDVKSGLDPTSIANGTKIIRIIGTMNTRSEARRACLGISRGMLKQGHAYVREQARVPRFKLWRVGTTPANLSHFDSPAMDWRGNGLTNNLQALEEYATIVEEELPPCIMALLNNSDIKDDGRQVVVQWLAFIAREDVDPYTLKDDSKRLATKVVCAAIEQFGNHERRKWKYMPARRVRNVIDNILNPYSCKRLEGLGMCVEPDCSFSDGGV